MSKKTNKKAKAKPKSQAPANAFVGGVHVSASFERSSRDGIPYNSLKSLYLDKENHLTGQAFCGETAFVCRKDEIPALVEFLTKISAASATAA